MAEESPKPPPRTVFNRAFKPGAGCILYHYCSTPAFLSVLENSALRFSDANMMNDSEEGRYGYALFERAANELLKEVKNTPSLEGLTPDFFDHIANYLSPKQLHSLGVIACFSKVPDELSQWRAYAQDGQGWAIGFAGDAIDAMPVTLLEVLYEPDQQIKEVRNSLAAMYFLYRESGGDFEVTDVGKYAALHSSLMVAYKHPSFRAEQEVRALHELRVDIAEDGILLTDEEETTVGKESKGQPVHFRAASASIIAYVDIPLARANGVTISELWLGPRNENHPGNAVCALTCFGHRKVLLRKSASPYRA